ncbi:MAG: tripartite tricarboxylate transporter substrate binding protein [Pseudomonadota bacterium]
MNPTLLTRRRLTTAAASAFISQLAFSRDVLAQAPARPANMRVISPYPAGGGTDGFARAISLKLADHFKAPVIVENRGGANGTLGAAVAARAAPDGGTLLIVAAGYAAGVGLYRNLPYDQDKDLAGVGLLASGPLVLVVHPSLPVKNVREFIEYAKARPDTIAYASSGIGSLPHLSAEQFSAMSGIRMTHVPYKGPAVAVPDVLSGRVPVYFNAIFASLPHIKAGKLRALGVTTVSRSPLAPEIPTIAESGLPNFDMTNWYGLLVPAQTPAAMVAELNKVVNQAMASPELQELAATGGMSITTGTPKQFDDYLRQETRKFDKLSRSLGLKEQ